LACASINLELGLCQLYVGGLAPASGHQIRFKKKQPVFVVNLEPCAAEVRR
jgi:hypothetical protein